MKSFGFLAEGHILEDVNRCVLALQEHDIETLDRTAGAIRGRCVRICNVVDAEMGNYERGVYTDRVGEAVAILRDQGKICYYREMMLIVKLLLQKQLVKQELLKH